MNKLTLASMTGIPKNADLMITSKRRWWQFWKAKYQQTHVKVYRRDYKRGVVHIKQPKSETTNE